MQYVWHSGVCITYNLALNQGVSGETQPNGPIHTLGKVRRKLCQNGYFQITLLFSYDAGRPVLEALYHAVNWERSTVDWPITNSPNVAIWHDKYIMYISDIHVVYAYVSNHHNTKIHTVVFRGLKLKYHFYKWLLQPGWWTEKNSDKFKCLPGMFPSFGFILLRAKSVFPYFSSPSMVAIRVPFHEVWNRKGTESSLLAASSLHNYYGSQDGRIFCVARNRSY